MMKRIVLFILVSLILGHVDAKQRQKRYRTKRTYKVGAIFGNDMRNSPMRAGFNYALAMQGNYNSMNRDVHLKPMAEFVDDISDSFQITTAVCRLISKQVVAIFGPIHFQTAHTIQSLTDYYSLLYITPSEASHYYNAEGIEQRGKYILKLRPIQTGAVIQYIKQEGWDRIFYLYDSRFALLRLRSIFENFNNLHMPLSTDVRQFNSFERSENMLSYIEDSSKEKKKRIILDLVDKQSQDLVLKSILKLGTSRTEYDFMLLGVEMNEVDLSKFVNGGFNLTVFSQIDFKDPYVKKFVKEHWAADARRASFATSLDGSLDRDIIPYDAALMIDGVRLLGKALNDLSTPIQTSHLKIDVPCISSTMPPYAADKILAAIVNNHLNSTNALTGHFQFDRLGFRRKYNISIHGTKVASALREFGYWTDLPTPHIVWDEKKDGKKERNKGKIDPGYKNRVGTSSNFTRVVTSILVPPFLFKKKDENGNLLNDSFEGFCVDLIRKVSEKANFSYVIKVVEDGNFGSELNKTAWNGMIGELLRGDAHIAVAPLTITSSRERVVDFSTPFMEVGLSIMFKKPDNPPKDVFSFMEPLSKEIWMCIAFAYLGVSVVLFMVSRFNPEEWHQLHNADVDGESKVTNDFSIFNSFWFSLSAFMQQGGDISPRSFSGRIVGGVWWFFTLIIVSSYTANLAAYLTVERMSTPIQSHEDLVKQTKIRYGVVNSGSSQEFFKTNNMATFKKMWSFMEANPEVFVKSMKDGVERVRKSNQDYAFLLESKMNEYYNQKHPCSTMKVGPNLDSGKGYGIATPSGSDLRDAINLAVLELKEKNEIHQMVRTWWEEKGECGNSEQKQEAAGVQNSLDLENVRGLFYILAGGLGFGISLSIVEFLYKCALEAKRKQRNFGSVLCEMMETSSKGKQRIPNTWAAAPPATPMSGLRSSGHPSPIPTAHMPDTMPTRSREKIDMDYPY